MLKNTSTNNTFTNVYPIQFSEIKNFTPICYYGYSTYEGRMFRPKSFIDRSFLVAFKVYSIFVLLVRISKWVYKSKNRIITISKFFFFFDGQVDVYNEERGWNTVAWKPEAWRESNEDAGQNKADDCWPNQGKNI